MSGLMCLARGLEMILPKPAFFLSLLDPHRTSTDGTLEDARLNTTQGFSLSEHEETFSVIQFLPCVSQLTQSYKEWNTEGDFMTHLTSCHQMDEFTPFLLYPQPWQLSDSPLKPVQGAKLAEKDSFFCAMSALSLLAMGSNDSNGHYKRRVKNMAMAGGDDFLHLHPFTLIQILLAAFRATKRYCQINTKNLHRKQDFSEDVPSSSMQHTCSILRGRTR